MKPSKPKKHNRSFGHRSAIDKLPARERETLWALATKDRLRLDDLSAWLKEHHGIVISRTSVWDWINRQGELGAATEGEAVRIIEGECEISISAPGAEVVRIIVRALPPGKSSTVQIHGQ